MNTFVESDGYSKLLCSFGVHNAYDEFRNVIAELKHEDVFEPPIDLAELFTEWVAKCWVNMGVLTVNYEIAEDEFLNEVSLRMQNYNIPIMDEYYYVRRLFTELNINPDTSVTLRLMHQVMFVYLE